MYYRIRYKNELCHFGIKGQRWGERRYQNEDGSYTPEGRIHYGIGSGNGRQPRTMIGRIIKTARDIDSRRKEVYDRAEKNRKIQEYMLKNGKGRVIDTKYSDIRKAQEYAEKESISELAKKHGFSKGAYGSINKTVNGVRYGINNDSDINTVNSILKDKNYFKSSPIEKEMKNQVSIWADAQGDKIKSFPKLKSVYAAGGTAEASYWYDGDDDILGGHSIDIEFDPKTKKVINISTNG